MVAGICMVEGLDGWVRSYVHGCMYGWVGSRVNSCKVRQIKV